MLASTHRFHGHNSLRFVYKNGAISRSKYTTIKAVSNPRRSHQRISVVVSRKISKHAIERNRIRRRIYEWFRRELPLLRPSVDIVCIVTSLEVMMLPANELDEALRSVVMRAGLYKTDAKAATMEPK